MCKQLLDVIEQIRCMEYELRQSGKNALLIIMTDCESTDGNIVDVLKPLEGMPLQIIIRMCTDERAVQEYWHNINAQLDLDIYVLDHMDIEAVEVMENNSWLTYAEPLHRMREFGMIPALNYLDYRQLTRTEIKSVVELLVGQSLHPDPEADWPAFVDAVATAVPSLPVVYCPVCNEVRPWVNIDQLARYEPDPIFALVELNEDLLWKIFVFYAYNAAALPPASRGGVPAAHPLVRLKSAPVFRSAAKYEKRLLHQDDLWKMMKDFDFVPTIVNTIRFNKLMAELGQRRSEQDKSKVRLCFREFIKVMVKISYVAYAHQKPARRLVRLLAYMGKSDNLGRMRDTGRVEGVDAGSAATALSFHLDDNQDDRSSVAPLTVLRFGGAAAAAQDDRTRASREDQADEEDAAKKAAVTKTVYELMIQRAADDEESAKVKQQEEDDAESDLGGSFSFGGESKAYDVALQSLRDNQRLEDELRLTHDTMESLTVELARTQGELRNCKAELGRSREQGVGVEADHERQRDGYVRASQAQADEKQHLEEALQKARAEVTRSAGQAERLVGVCKAEVDAVKKAALSDAQAHEVARNEWARKLSVLEGQVGRDRSQQGKNAELEQVVESMTLLLQDAREGGALSTQRVGDLEAKVAGRDEQIRALRGQLIEAQAVQAEQQAEIGRLSRLSRSLAAAEAQVKRASDLLAERDQQSAAALTASKHAVADLQAEVAALGARMALSEADHSSRLRDVRSQLDASKAEVRALSVGKEEIIHTHREKASGLEVLVASLNAQLALAGEKISTMEEAVAVWQTRAAEYEGRIKLITGENDLAEAEISALQGRLKQVEGGAARDGELVRSLSDRVGVLTGQLQTATAAKTATDHEILGLVQQLRSLETGKREGETSVEEMQSRIVYLEKKLEASEKQSSYLDQQLESAHGRIGFLVTESESRLEQVGDLLGKLEAADEMHAQLEGRVLAASALLADLSSKLSDAGEERGLLQDGWDAANARIALLEGHIHDGGVANADLQARLDRLASLDLEGQLADQRGETEHYRIDLQNANMLLQDLEARYDDFHVEVGELTVQLAAAQLHNTNLADSLQAMTIAKTTVEEGLSRRVAELEVLLVSFRGKLKDARDRLDGSQAESSGLKADLVLCQKEFVESEARCRALETDLIALRRRITSLESDNTGLREELRQHKEHADQQQRDLQRGQWEGSGREQALEDRCRALLTDLAAAQRSADQAVSDCLASRAAQAESLASIDRLRQTLLEHPLAILATEGRRGDDDPPSVATGVEELARRLVDRLSDAQSRLESYATECDTFDDVRNGLEETLAATVADAQSVRVERDRLEGLNRSHIAALEALRGEGAAEGEELMAVRVEMERLKVYLNSLLADNDALLRAQAVTDAATAEIAALKKQLADLQALQKKTSDELAVLTKLHKDLTATKAAADKRVAELEAQGKKDTAEISFLKKQLADTNSILDSFREEQAQAESLITALEGQGKKDADEIAVLKKQLKAQLKKDNDINGVLKKDVDELTTAKTAADKRLAELEALAEKNGDEIAALKKKVADVMASGAAAKAARDRMIADMEEDLKKANNELAAMKKEVSVVTTDNAAAVKRIAELEALAEKNGDEIAALKKKGVDVTASGAAAKASRDRMIADMEMDLKKANNDNAALTKKFNSLAATAKTAADKRIAELEAQGKKDTDEIAALTKRIADLSLSEKEATLLRTRSAKDAVEIASLTDQLAHVSSASTTLTQQINTLKVQLALLADELEASRRDAETVQQQLDEWAAAHAAVVLKNRTLKVRHHADAAKIATLQGELSAKDDEIGNAVMKLAKIQSLNTAKEALSGQIKSLTQGLDSVHEDYHHTQTQRAALLDEQRRLVGVVETLTLQAAAAQATSDATRGEMGALEKALQKERSTVAALRDQLAQVDGRVDAARVESNTRKNAEREDLVRSLSGIEKQLSVVRGQLVECTSEKDALAVTHREKVADLEGLLASFKQKLKDTRDQMSLRQSAEAAVHAQLVAAKVEVAHGRIAHDALMSSYRESVGRIADLEAGRDKVSELVQVKARLNDALRQLENCTCGEDRDRDRLNESVLSSPGSRSGAGAGGGLFGSGDASPLKTQVAQLTRQMTSTTEEKTQAERRVDELKRAHRRLIGQLADSDRTITTLRGDIDSVGALSMAKDRSHLDRIGSLEALRIELEELLDVANARGAALEGDKKALLAETGDLQVEVETLREEMAELLRERGELLSRHMAQMVEMQDAGAMNEVEFRTEVAILREKVKNLRERLNEGKAGKDVAGEDGAGQVLAERLAELQAENAALQRTVNGLRELVESNASKDVWVKRHAAKEAECASVQAQLATVRAQLSDAKTDKDRLSQSHAEKLAGMEAILKSFKDQLADAKTLLDRATAENDSSAAEARRLLDEERAIVQRSLEAQGVLTKRVADVTVSSSAAKAARDRMIADMEEDLKKANNDLVAMKKEVSVVTTDNAAAVKRIAELETLAEKNGDEIAGLKKKVADVAASGSAAKAARDRMIADMEGDIKKANNDVKILATDNAAAVKRIAELEALAEKNGDEIAALKKKGVDVMASGAAAKASRDRMIADMEMDLKKANNDNAALSKKLRAQAATNAATNKRIAELETLAEKNGDEIAGLKKKVGDVAASGSAAKASRDRLIADMEMDLKKANNELAAMKKNGNVPNAAAEKHITELENAAAEKHITELEKEKHITELENCINELTALRAEEIDEMAALKNDLEQSHEDLHTLIDECKTAAEALSVVEKEVLTARKRCTVLEGRAKKGEDETIEFAKKLNDVMATADTAKMAHGLLVFDLEGELKMANDDVVLSAREVKARGAQAEKDATEIAALKKKGVDVMASGAAAKASRDRMIADMEMDLKKANNDNAALSKKFSAQAATNAATNKRIAELEVLAEKNGDEIAALKKKGVDVMASGAAAKAARDRMIADMEEDLKKANAASATEKKALTERLAVLEKECKAGKDAFVALESGQKVLAAAKAITDKEIEAHKTQAEKDATEIAALKKKVADVTTSSTAAKAARDRTIADLEEDLKKNNAALKASASALAGAERDVASSRASEAAFKKDLSAAAVAREELLSLHSVQAAEWATQGTAFEATLAAREAEWAGSAARVAAAEGENAALRLNMKEVRGHYESMRSKLSRLEGTSAERCAKLQYDLDAAVLGAREAIDEQERLQEVVTAVGDELAAIRADVTVKEESLVGTLEQLRRELERLQGGEARATARAEGLQQQLLEATAEAATLGGQADELRKAQAVHEHALAEKAHLLETYVRRVAAMSEENQRLAAELTALGKEGRLATEIAAMKSEIERLRNGAMGNLEAHGRSDADEISLLRGQLEAQVKQSAEDNAALMKKWEELMTAEVAARGRRDAEEISSLHRHSDTAGGEIAVLQRDSSRLREDLEARQAECVALTRLLAVVRKGRETDTMDDERRASELESRHLADQAVIGALTARLAEAATAQGELTNQLAALHRAAAEATSARVQSTEVAALRSELAAVKGQLVAVTGQLQRTKNDVAAGCAELTSMRLAHMGETRAYTDQIDQLERQVDQYQTEVAALETTAKEYEDLRADTERTAAATRTQLHTLTEQVAELRTTLQTAQSEAANAKSEAEAAAAVSSRALAVNEASLADSRAEVARLRAALSSCQESLRDETLRAEGAVDEGERLRQEGRERQADGERQMASVRATYEHQVGTLERALAEGRAALIDEGATQTAQLVAQHASDHERWQSALSEAQAALAGAERRGAQAEAEAGRCQCDLGTVRDELESVKIAGAGVERALSAEQDRLSEEMGGLTARLRGVEREHAALQGDKDELLRERSEAAVKYAEERREVDAQLASVRRQLEQLTNEGASAAGRLREVCGETAALKEALLARTAELHACKERAARAAVELEERLRAEIAAAGAQIDLLSRQGQADKCLLLDRASDVDRLEASYRASEQRCEGLARDLDRTERAAREKSNAIAHLEAALSTHREALAEAGRLLTDTQAALADAQRDAAGAATRLAHAEREAAQHRTAALALEGRLASQMGELQDATGRAASAQADFQAARGEVENLRLRLISEGRSTDAAVADLQAQLHSLQSELHSEVDSQLSSLLLALQGVTEEASRNEQRAQELLSAVGVLEGEKVETEGQMAALRGQLASAAADASAEVALLKRTHMLELHSLHGQLDAATEAITQGEAQRANDAETIAALRCERVDDVAELVSLRGQVSALTVQLAEAGRAYEELTGAEGARVEALTARLSGDVDDLRRRLTVSESEVDRLASEKDALQREVEGVARDAAREAECEGNKWALQVANLNMQVIALQVEYQAYKDSVQGTMADLEEEARRAGESLTDAQSGRVNDADTIASLTEQISLLGAAKDAAERRVGRLEEDHQSAAGAVAALDHQVGDLNQRMGALASEYQGYKESSEVKVAVLHAEKQSLIAADDARGREVDDQLSSLLSTLQGVTEEASRNEQRVQELLSAVGVLEGEKATREAEVAVLQGRLAGVDAESTGVGEEVAELKYRLAEEAKCVAELDSQMRRIAEENEVTEDECTALKKRVAELEAQCKKDTAEIAALTTRIAELDIQDADGSAVLAEKVDDLSTALATADDRIAELEAEDEKHTAKIASWQSQIRAITTEYDQAEMVIEEQSVRLGELEAQGRRVAADNAALTGQLADLTTTKAAADKRISELEGQGKKDMDEIDALKKQLADAMAAVATAKTVADKRIGELEGRVKGITEENELAEKEVVELTSGIAELEAHLRALTDEYEAFKRGRDEEGRRDERDARERVVAALEDEVAQLHAQAAIARAEASEQQSRYNELIEQFTQLERMYQEVVSENATLNSSSGSGSGGGGVWRDAWTPYNSRAAEPSAKRTAVRRAVEEMTARQGASALWGQGQGQGQGGEDGRRGVSLRVFGMGHTSEAMMSAQG